jgi:hypothetical protein
MAKRGRMFGASLTLAWGRRTADPGCGKGKD